MCPLSINLSKISYPEVKNKKLVGDLNDYLIKNGLTISNKNGIRAENINSCTAGVLNGGNKHFVFHAAPELQPLKSIKKELTQKVELLRKSCDDVKGFICGGWELNPSDKESVKSFNLYNTIADVLDSLGVKFSMICGKEKGGPFDNIYSVNNNVTMWNENFAKLGADKNTTKERLLDLLENQYQFVESNSEQELKMLENFTPKVQHLIG